MTDMFPLELSEGAGACLADLEARGLRLVTAESCTGGLLAALLTGIGGASKVFERGFVTYSNAAKAESLGISPPLIERHGAVSAEVAAAMAEGALRYSRADVALAITGIAGPDGGSPEKPVGLVYIAVAWRDSSSTVRAHRFGAIGRSGVRLASLYGSLALLRDVRVPGSP